MPYSYDPNTSSMIAEGVHTLTVTSVDDGFSRKGDQMWTVRLEDHRGREIIERIVLPLATDWKLRPLWEAAGLQWPGAADILDEHKLIDRKVQATITHKTSQDWGTQAEIQGYTRPGNGNLPGQESLDINGYGHKQPAVVDDNEEIPF